MFAFFTRSSEDPSQVSTPGEQTTPDATATKETSVTLDVVLPLIIKTEALSEVSTQVSPSPGAPANGDVQTTEPTSTTSPARREDEPKEPPTEGSAEPVSSEGDAANVSDEKPARPALESAPRRFSWRTSFFGGDKRQGHKTQLSSIQEHAKAEKVVSDHALRERKLTHSERKAKASAQVVRTLIVGPSGISPSQAKTKAVSKRKMERVKSELINPKSANRLIAQLRAMPSSNHPVVSTVETAGPLGPIHAVCLAYTDAEAHERHFSKLSEDADGDQPNPIERSRSLTSTMASVANVTNASISQLTALFSELHIVSLIATPDFGLGQPGDGPGLLSGALPPAETVLEGVQEITPQLMALGYATGKAILPDHAGVYPPTDRMSVITYWWGFEVALPPPSITFLSNVPSVSHALINFLTGLSLVNGGVREILPFVRYISQYIDAEFSMIRDNDRGKGVVCAATWILPAALVPRPWDFPDPPKTAPGEEGNGSATRPTEPPNATLTPSPPPPAATSPPSLPALTPPLPLPSSLSVSSAPNAAYPVDDTPVDAVAPDTTVPTFEVIPPLPLRPHTPFVEHPIVWTMPLRLRLRLEPPSIIPLSNWTMHLNHT
ncbi:hypothetical protein EIP91_004469 [Steccherinum ochraceum]|uniref:Uncharacterized protein n=1 Tax=Steccherinum ochraceum TaxID=92696 RepID=A0A4R0RBA7_9APHY|nr:hypothetical protein EIP91_004469 [Steccherinum ochraceum]